MPTVPHRTTQADEIRLKGNALVGEGKWLEAMDAYTVALSLRPSAATYSNRSLCRYKVKDYEGAKQDAENAMQQDPKFVKAYYRHGAALIALRDPDAAAASLKHGCELQPNNADMCQLLQKAEWMRIPRTLEAQRFNARTQYNTCYSASADHTRTRLFLEEAEAQHRRKLTTLVDIGKHFYVKGEVDDAERVVVCLGLDVYMEMSRSDAILHLRKTEALLSARCDMYERHMVELQ